MAFKLFADTNVYLDFLLQRGKEWESAESIFRLAEDHSLQLFTSASCLLNLVYVMGSYKIKHQEIIEATHGILSYSRLINPGNTIFQTALLSGFADLEDGVQYYTALQEKGMDYFITSNTRDYKKALPQLPALTPKQFMHHYQLTNR